jgi:membrane fusion protein (multidrug efflux system)
MIFKHFNMNSTIKLTASALMVIFAIACGSGTKESKDGSNDKKAQLQKLKEQQDKINKQVSSLEEELAKTDTAAANAVNAKLITVTPVAPTKFTHYIDLQGRVDAQNISYVTPRGAGGQVRAVYVKQGDLVKKGQLLIKLDDVLSRQQVDQANVQLNLAQTLYERRKNLWDKQIGTEVELLQAKNNVDNLKKQISLLNEQAGMTNVYAEQSGVADMVNIRVGEFFSPASATVAGIRIVNTSNLKVTAQVPENYLHKVDQGATVQITLPDINKTVTSKVSVKGASIDPNSRSFYIEAKVPNSPDFRPNQIAMVKIQDYAANNAITVPMNTLQNDEKGKYVMVAANENGKLVAKKKQIQVGELYGNDLEVKSGLEVNDALITEGFQGLYDGQPVTTQL